MDDRSYLHDGEVLLCSMRSSPAMLVASCARGVLEGLAVAVVLSGVLIAALFFGAGVLPPWYVYVLIALLCVAVVVVQRWRVWLHATFRITSERILLTTPGVLFHPPLHTVKWPQYQESHAGTKTFLDLFFLSRPLSIRYGTADALHESTFPSLRYAQDLKHYLDKIDSAFRKNEMATVRPFVAKPRGKRDDQ